MEFKIIHLSGETSFPSLMMIMVWKCFQRKIDTEKAFLTYSVLSVTRIKIGERNLK